MLEESTHKPYANVLKDYKIESSKTKTSCKNKHVKSMTRKVVLGYEKDESDEEDEFYEEDDEDQNHDEELSTNKIGKTKLL